MTIRKFDSKQMHERLVGPFRVMYSYEEPVVIYDGENYFVTAEHFSTTTTRQINFYLKEVKAQSVNKLSPDLFHKLGAKLNLF